MQVSIMQSSEYDHFDLESLDISVAFMQGLTFSELIARARELGLDVRTTRKVYLRPPAYVWRHLCNIWGWQHDESYARLWVLELVKQIPGLIDAPLL